MQFRQSAAGYVSVCYTKEESKTVKKTNDTNDLLKLEKVVRKVITKALKDRTLDYVVQFSVSSLEPKKVKYSFMINGTKKEVRIEPQSADNFATVMKIAEGMLENYDPVELEKTFHESRINSYKAASDQHQKRLDYLNDPNRDTEDDDIVMEELAAESVAKPGE